MSETPQNVEPDRRDFLKTAGKIGLVVPPAMVFLLSTSMSSDAIARSGGEPAKDDCDDRGRRRHRRRHKSHRHHHHRRHG